MKLHLFLPALLGVLFLSGCVVEEPYARGRYHDRGSSFGYRDTVYVEGRSYPRYHDSVYVEGRSSPRYRDNSYYSRNNYRDYDRSDYRSRTYNSNNYDRSRSDSSHSGNQGRSYRSSRTPQRSVSDPASEYYKQQRSKSVKNQQKSKEKEDRNRD